VIDTDIAPPNFATAARGAWWDANFAFAESLPPPPAADDTAGRDDDATD
jgi:hypothetical protein